MLLVSSPCFRTCILLMFSLTLSGFAFPFINQVGDVVETQSLDNNIHHKQKAIKISAFPCPDLTKGGMLKNYPSGCFDFYMLIQSWYPEFCFLNEQQSPICRAEYRLPKLSAQLSLHTFHPQFKSYKNRFTSPIYCSSEYDFKVEDLEPKLVEDLHSEMPQDTVDHHLMYHMWQKHGTCSALDPKKFFEAVLELSRKTNPSGIFTSNIGKSISYDQLLEHYLNINISKDMFVPICRSYDGDSNQYLRSVWTQVGKKDLKLQPIDPSIIETLSNKNSLNDNLCSRDKPISIRKASRFLSTKELSKDISMRYKNQKLSVGFDFDGTIIDSSMLEQRIILECGLAKERLCVNKVIMEVDGNGYDYLGPFKKSTTEMIKFHFSRGDNVYIITKRQRSKTAQMPTLMRKMFEDYGQFSAIDYTNSGSKVELMKKYGLDLYYGDMDSDISYALASGTTPIRVVGYNSRKVNIGFAGEDVLFSKELTLFAPNEGERIFVPIKQKH